MQLIIDSNSLAYKSFYSMRGLRTKEKETAVSFGFMKDILMLAKKYETNKFYFCWDSKKSYRKKIYKLYKANRKPKDKEKEKELKSAYSQFDDLKNKILPRLGFKHVYEQDYYESDDLMAWLVDFNRIWIGDKLVVVTNDGDLYQVLEPGVKIYNHSSKKETTMRSFKREYGILPSKWAEVKAIGGCSTDNVKGIKGVGEKTAISYLLGNLKKGKKFDDIKNGEKIINRNRKLVTLPFDGSKVKGGVYIGLLFAMEIFRKEDFIQTFDDYSFASFLKGKLWKDWQKVFSL